MGGGRQTWLDDMPPACLGPASSSLSYSIFPPVFSSTLLSRALLPSFALFVLLRFLVCLSSCDHDSDKLQETLRNLTFHSPLSRGEIKQKRKRAQTL
jgi:hypothetical protein